MASFIYEVAFKILLSKKYFYYAYFDQNFLIGPFEVITPYIFLLQFWFSLLLFLIVLSSVSVVMAFPTMEIAIVFLLLKPIAINFHLLFAIAIINIEKKQCTNVQNKSNNF